MEYYLYEITVGVTIIAGCVLGWVLVSMVLLMRIATAIENLKVNATATSVGCPSCGAWHEIDNSADVYTEKDGTAIDHDGLEENSDGA